MNRLFFSIPSGRWLIPVMAFILALSAAPLQGQQVIYDYPVAEKQYTRMSINESETAACLTNDATSRQQPTEILDVADYLLNDNDNQLWTNGIGLYRSYYDDEDARVGFEPQVRSNNYEEIIAVIPPSLKVKGRNVVLSGKPNVKVSVERIAGHILLVGRNAQGMPVMALHYVTPEQMEQNTWTLLALYPVLGNYTIASGRNVVFGPKMDFYSGKEYDKDPGMIEAYHIYRDLNQMSKMNIIYGNKRINRGDPAVLARSKERGAGGAGAIMGPMMWNIAPSVEGLCVIVVHDEPFVDHFPAVGKEGETATLTKVQGPYPGLDGKWTFASVIPLTETLLRLFPKEVLTLMRGEIYARHGDTFKDPATQRYFDAQPWYKKSGTPISLTDVERFNYQLIKQVEMSK